MAGIAVVMLSGMLGYFMELSGVKQPVLFWVLGLVSGAVAQALF